MPTNTRGSGAQAPIHSDADPALAHAYARTRVNFHHPEESTLVVRMRIDRHNCFGSSCEDAGRQMQAAVDYGGAQFFNCRHFTGTGGLQQSAPEADTVR